MSEPDEERIRRAFGSLRAADARRAPSFEASRRAPPRRPVRPLLVASPIVALVAAAAVFVALCAPPALDRPQRTTVVVASAPPSPDTSMPEPLPLDFLLDDTFSFSGNGRAFLARVPDFDSDPSRGPVQ